VSVDAASSWQLSASNSFARSENAMISVGHTKLQRGLHRQVYKG
jgi:hypothetical protein